MSNSRQDLQNHHLRISGDDATVTLTPAAGQTAVSVAANLSTTGTLGGAAISGTTVTGTGAVSGLNLVAATAAATALPVLKLTQLDLSEEYMRFVGTSADTNANPLVDAANLTTPGNIAGWIKIYVQDDKASGAITDGIYYIPFYTTPTA